ncbi:hypothetical protein QNI19_02745 [Cytophagaceae bacterium DM2B3-1]|uniref:Metal-dependent hydrolase n=1 Tax=Xanthocytophaga flava TaxID=3048013 RepID=A0ABT7CDP2_9BACT|nr:hypothetical protein [Xanthocytophaga flavus]MDJ1491833.1 hypothetical protein [Xanthocytophaga flavus]
MNVLFHTTTAIGVAVLLTNTTQLEKSHSLINRITTGIAAFTVGAISHGALDYIPHCYPINSKIDVAIGLAMILVVTWLTHKRYRIIVGASFLGCIFPDIADLSPAIINKQVGLNLPVFSKIFPWHWHAYSGSIYTGDCNVSTINHLLLIVVICAICWYRQEDVKRMIG